MNREEASSGTAQREQAEQPAGEALTASSQGGAETNNNPGTPDNPDQVPLGGAEYLAAAGAAYALNRLRKNGDEEDEESDDMP